jgi:hydroxymethylpyrimidine kinase/phosphomethylpyrimidine kinase/thiamine-phosphate diphosphorylase
VRPIVLTIAGSDPSGGAGIQGDLKAIEACSGWGATAITAITVQNSRGVQRTEVLDPTLVAAQIDAVLVDLDVRAVKSGMLGNAQVIEAVARALAARPALPYVLDPVLAATDGHPLLAADAREALLSRLVPRATLITPNAGEAAALSGLERVEDRTQAERAGRRLLARGARAVLVKGGHLAVDRGTDLLIDAAGVRAFHAEPIAARHTHGAGCAYAAAIATELAWGRSLEQSVERAKAFVTRAIRGGLALGAERGPVDARAPLGRLHVITDETVQMRFTHREIARLAAEAGADVIQFREKRPWAAAELVRVAREIREDIAPFGTQLIVNDRADVAAAAGAAGVHLGRSDLDPQSARDLLGPRRFIGRTVHTLEQLGLGGAADPADYLGVGPVFGTSSKADPATELGLEGLRRIARAAERPVIAIGNVTAERVDALLEAGAWGVAVLSAVLSARDPAESVGRLAQALARAGRSVTR